MKFFCLTLYDDWIEIELDDETLIIKNITNHDALPKGIKGSREYRNVTNELNPEFFKFLERFISHLIEVYERINTDDDEEPPLKIQRKRSDGSKKRLRKKSKNKKK